VPGGKDGPGGGGAKKFQGGSCPPTFLTYDVNRVQVRYIK